MGCSLEYTNFPKFWLQKYDTFRLPVLSILIKASTNPQPIIISMLIQFDKYQPNSLRRGKTEALQKDLHDAFTAFSTRFQDPKMITMNEFINFWNVSQIKLIIHLRNEQEDEEEYFNVIYKILISEYFLKGNDAKKVYCLLCIYFFAFSIDMNGDRNPRYIYVNPQFLQSLSQFLRHNAEYHRQLFIKAIRKIKELFIYGIKLGPREPLIKKNGETFVRYPKPCKKLTRDNYSPAILQIKDVLPGLEDVVKSYQESKEKLFRNFKDQSTIGFKKHMNFDKNISLRLAQILKSYDSEVTYVEEDMKHIAQQPMQAENVDNNDNQ